MVDRRRFLKMSALIAVGLVAADQIELVERLGWKRRFFPSAALLPTGPYAELIGLDGSVLQRTYATETLYGPSFNFAVLDCAHAFLSVRVTAPSEAMWFQSRIVLASDRTLLLSAKTGPRMFWSVNNL